MKIEFEINNTENMNPTPEKLEKYAQVCKALIQTGSLDGVKGGQAIIHFDKDGNFMGVQHSYWPFRRRRL